MKINFISGYTSSLTKCGIQDWFVESEASFEINKDPGEASRAGFHLLLLVLQKPNKYSITQKNFQTKREKF